MSRRETDAARTDLRPTAEGPSQPVAIFPLALIAAAGFGWAVTLSRDRATAGLLLALTATLLCLRSRPVLVSVPLRRVVLAIGPLLFSLVWLRGHLAFPFDEPGWFHWTGGAVWIGCSLLLLAHGDLLAGRTRLVIVSLALLLTGVSGSILIDRAENTGLDVTGLHMEAATAIDNGQSPYSDAVNMEDGSPLAGPGDLILGYPYPPVALFPFALSELVLDDPRWVSLAAWLGFLAVIGRWALRERGSAVALSAFVMAAALPGWPRVLLSSWTEPVSLALLAMAFLFWERWKSGSAILLGIGLASKQSLAVLWPLVLVWQPSGRTKRAMLVTGAAALALSPILFWGIEDAYRSLVEFHLTRPARNDGTSLVGILDLAGISWSPPTWLSLVAPLLVAFVAGRVIRDRRSFALAASLTLSAAFLFSSQAFMNYWLIPAGLLTMVAAAPAEKAHA